MLHGYSQSLAQPTWAYMDFVTVVLPAPGPNDADPCQTAGRPVAFHLAFLRDNCPKAVNASSGQKAHSSGALPAFGGPGLQITFGPGVRGSLYQSDPRTAAPLICHVDDGADTVPEPADGHPALRIVWPDGNASTFTASWLRQRAYDRRHLPVGEQQTLARSALRRHLGPKALYWDAQSWRASLWD
ncbi:hypothetical protein H696_04522 [Fonticula alba]|uniref:Uncharacterized protein n=1 Tax=Fonticula alba TaxID=691883 RepID=A0A058Z4Q3_FONAL|nr:hypothetical protein H696_04522 [Fonticula alba]KCV69106.1 hypothetical protein H696_04522 [Fonticula alba]|eukprot:XP_009496677.1 hypothetical protein H696_04522 [Fonticula alba]